MSLIAPMGEYHRGNFKRNLFFKEKIGWILITEHKVCYNVYRLL